MRGLLSLGFVLAFLWAAPAAADVGILAVGDFGVGGESQQTLGAAVRTFEARNPADVLVTLGDNDYSTDPEAFRANWLGSFGWLRSAGVRVAGTLGNHDVHVDGGRYQFGPLGMPARFYTRRIGDSQLFLLDSTSVDAAQTRWLRRTLAASRARWKIAVFHHPAYTCGRYRANGDVLRRFVPLLERFRVQLVLSGHDHNYQRFRTRNGVTYVVHGGGSTTLYPLSGCPAGYPRRLRARLEHGFLYLRVGRRRLEGFAVTVSGLRTDRFALVRA
jgi:3',5'-cyclic AMP phosphodiesterase CpdA